MTIILFCVLAAMCFAWADQAVRTDASSPTDGYFIIAGMLAMILACISAARGW